MGKYRCSFKVEKFQWNTEVPFAVPGPAGYWYTGAIIQWKGKEQFAGDQVQTLLENGAEDAAFRAVTVVDFEVVKWRLLDSNCC